MRLLISLILVLSCAKIHYSWPIDEPCRTDAYPPEGNKHLPKYTVNLDESPSTRWNHLVKDKKKELLEILDVFKEMMGPAILNKLDIVFGILTAFLPDTYKEEIRGLSTASGVGVGEVALYNVFYELFTACTSLVGEDVNGNMFHARNMDFGLLMGWDNKNNTWLVSEKLRNLLVEVTFQKNKTTIYKAVTFVGYVGVLTAIKPDAFTFSIDERFTLNGGWAGLVEWLIHRGLSKARWLGFLTRDVMEQANSYEEAYNLFLKEELIAPAYFIIGGNQTGQAAIITRARKGADNIWKLKSPKYPNQWYLIETNYDHWEKPLFFDDRRTPAKKCMKEMTQKGMGFKGLYNVLSTKPVLNKLTVYTALMNVKGGELESYLQDCQDPCWPW